MNANLMGPPRVQMRTQQVSRCEAGEPEKIRLRLPAGIDDCHPLSVSRVARDRLVDDESIRVEVPPYHHRVPAFHATRRNRGAQDSMRPLGFRDKQQSRSFLIQPVYDSRSVRSGSGGEIATAPHQSVHQGTCPVPRCRVHNHACRLVYDQYLLVLESDFDRYRFTRDGSLGDDRLIHYHPVACDGPIRGLLTLRVHGHVAVRDERRCLCAGKSQLARHKQIEANVSVRLDKKFVSLARAHISWPRLDAGAAIVETSPSGVDAARPFASSSSPQSTHASRNAPMLTAMSATLNVGQRVSPRPTSMKSTTPREERTRSIRFPSAPAQTRAIASVRTRSPSRVAR